MNEFMEVFKKDVEELFDEMYYQLDGLIDNALFELECSEEVFEERYEMIQKVMMDVLQERIITLYSQSGEL